MTAKSKEDILREGAVASLKIHKDRYPAGALDPDSCFYNGQIGNCGKGCPVYVSRRCPFEDEVRKWEVEEE